MELWQRARDTKHSLIVGGPVPASPDDLTVIRVDCGRASSTFGPLERARTQVEELLGEHEQPWDQVGAALGSTLRSRLLGEGPDRSSVAAFVGAANRLAQAVEQPTVVVFEGVEHADAATLGGLGDIIRLGDRLRLPLILHLSQRPSAGPAHRLLLTADEASSFAVIELDAPKPAATATFDWTRCPSDVLVVLRAASVVGHVFEVDLVAKMLDRPIDGVLVALQQAADLGAPLSDGGEGHLTLPADAAAQLRGGLLPSVVAHWHRRLAEVLDEARPPQPPPEPEATAPQRPRTPPPPTKPETPPADDYAAVFDGEPSAAKPDAVPPPPAPATDDAAPAPHRTRRHRRRRRPTRDPVRAAAHLTAAGEVEAAVARYIGGIEEVAHRGDPARALHLAQQALSAVEQIPVPSRRTEPRARILLAAGRVQWNGAGLGPGLTLQDALETLSSAKEALLPDAPVTLKAEIAVAIAGVGYDLGDIRSLERALGELHEVSRELMVAGEPLAAARLLNDQAAVYLRAGDPVVATHLLTRSQEVFAQFGKESPGDPTIEEEVAETDHLLARLPLHARLKSGREKDAYSIALGHARAAERRYRHLDRTRELGRVWETMGRLELARSNPTRAEQFLDQAFGLQRKIGDVTGLARTVAAIADLKAQADEAEAALQLLEDSIALNFEKGSPIGLAFNRRTLRRLASRWGDRASAGDLRGAFEQIEARLEDAEEILGRVELVRDDAAAPTA